VDYNFNYRNPVLKPFNVAVIPVAIAKKMQDREMDTEISLV